MQEKESEKEASAKQLENRKGKRHKTSQGRGEIQVK
jgi:hypothetical protein